MTNEDMMYLVNTTPEKRKAPTSQLTSLQQLAE